MIDKIRVLFTLVLLMIVSAACGGTAVSPTPTPTTPPQPVPEEAPANAGTGSIRTFVLVSPDSQASYIVNEEFFAEALTKLGITAGKRVVVGSTSGITGEIQLDFDTPELVQAAQFTVDMSSLATDQNRRDEWLTENAIETGVFPQATFIATSASGLPQTINEGEEIHFQLIGDLTVRDVTNSVTFDVTAVLSNDTIKGTATLPLQMTDFGITPPDFVNTLTVANAFTIEINLLARES